MSYCEVYAVDQQGDVHLYGEACNAWGGAMFIWTKLDEKYGTKPPNFPGEGFGPMSDFKALWALTKQMETRDQWVIRSTYDNVMVKKEHLPLLIKALKEFTLAGYNTATLQEEISILGRAAQDASVQAVCFNQTSVNADTWRVYGEGDDDECRPYNINRDTGHWFLEPWEKMA